MPKHHSRKPVAPKSGMSWDEQVLCFLTQRSVDKSKYKELYLIGEGTFGIVVRAQERNNPNNDVAIKYIKRPKGCGFPELSLREIRILKELDHKNIVKLIDLCRGPCYDFQLVFEYCEFNLGHVLKGTSRILSISHKKSMAQQLLDGVHFMHFNEIVHRDLKPANILVNMKGVLKLADFGSARCINTQRDDGDAPEKLLTSVVVTLWYRAPEILLGDPNYGLPLDMWSVGCIIAEMFTIEPLLRGDSDLNQIKLIMGLCGPITPQVWPGVEKLRSYNAIQKLYKSNKRCVKEYLQKSTKNSEALDLVDKLLTMDPKGRLNVDKALNHDFFFTAPLAEDFTQVLRQIPKNVTQKDQNKN